MGTQIAAMLATFGRTIGFSNLAFNEKGYCCLQFDSYLINIEFTEDLGLLHLYSKVGKIPEKGKRALFEKLLETNFLYHKTAGCVLGINTEHNAICLAYQCRYPSIDSRDFELLITNFVNLTEFWTKEIQNFSSQEQESVMLFPECSPFMIRV